MAKTKKSKGVSLAKGPVALLGLALLVYGVTGLIFGGQSFSSSPVDGTVNGEKWLGLEVNGWSNLLFIAAGALLLFGSPLHWGAKTMSLIVGLALGAASVIALVDESDVFGIFAANGLTKLVWGAAAALLLILALLPRVGGKEKEPDDLDRGVERDRPRDRQRDEREAVGDDDGSRAGSRRVVAPADGTASESQTTRRRRDQGEH